MPDQYMVFVPGSSSPPQGPIELGELTRRFHGGDLPPGAKVAKVGDTSWLPIEQVVPTLIEEGAKTFVEPLPLVVPEKTYEVTVDGEHVVGPVTLDQLRRGFEIGKLQADAKVRLPGESAWTPITEVVGRATAQSTEVVGRATVQSTVAQHDPPKPPAPGAPGIPKTGISKPLKVGLAVGGVILVGLVTFAAWPDPAGRQLRAGKQFEQEGKVAEALASFGKVCEWDPKGRACVESLPLIWALRIKAAQEAISRLAFREAQTFLAPVIKDGSNEARGNAKALLESREVVEGLRWEQAATTTDKAAAMVEMEKVAAAGVRASEKAQEWLARERPAILLQVVRGTCPGGSFERCKAAAGRLRELHPSASETPTAMLLLNAATAAEERRIHAVLVEAEKLLSSRAGLKRTEKRRQECYLRELASNPDNAFAALHVCGDATDDQKAVEKVEAAWKLALGGLGTSPKRSDLEARWRAAEEDGEYKKQSLRNPEGSPRGSGAASPQRPDPPSPCGCLSGDLMCNMKCSAATQP